ncbi:MAG: AAA family ATPase [Ruminococcaceae bacterium]|nr:AAA family ATPase [Oscillospiraceae bacterium]
MKTFFSLVAGNDALRTRFGTDILNSSLPHAFIIEGPRGTGKHTVARSVAAALVCENKDDPQKPLPCLCCRSCRMVMENKAPDVITVGKEEGKSTIGVDSARFIREDVRIVPNDFEHKIYIIEDAEKMTPQAQNALLLTLEEPPKYVHFLLLCESSDSLLETIKSRAPIVRTELLSTEKIDGYLCSVDRRASQMKLSDPKGYAELLTASESGGIGKALEFLDGRAFAPLKQKRELVLDIVCRSIKGKGAPETVPALLRLSQKREVLSEQLLLLSDAIRDLILLKRSDSPRLSFFSDRELAMELSDKVSISFLYIFEEAVHTAIDELKKSANVKLCITNMAIRANIL